MSAEDAEKPQHDARASKDAEANRDAANSNTNGVMAVDVEGLSRPEHEDREEVSTGDEGDDERKTQNARLVSQALGEHGMLCAIGLPKDERDDEHSAKDERNECVSRMPRILAC